jgi:hypothetical protein
MSERDPYVAIMVAAACGRGIHLTAEETQLLSMDDAVSTRAVNGLSLEEQATFLGFDAIDTKKQRVPGGYQGVNSAMSARKQ